MCTYNDTKKCADKKSPRVRIYKTKLTLYTYRSFMMLIMHESVSDTRLNYFTMYYIIILNHIDTCVDEN